MERAIAHQTALCDRRPGAVTTELRFWLGVRAESPFIKLDLQPCLPTSLSQRSDARLVGIDRVGRVGIIIEGAGFMFLDQLRISLRETS